MNSVRRNTLGTPQPGGRLLSAGDIVILIGLAVVLYAGLRLAIPLPTPVIGPEINLSASALPWYALLSVTRMTVAYFLSLSFSLVYGYIAARNKSAERIMLPILDVLQSLPILSFLPVVLLSLSALLPQGFAAEIAAVILIFTSQAWNLTFSFYQSVRTVPGDLQEASEIFRMNWWYRLRHMELPFGALALLWNSVMSWAGGWFFLMAAETFKVGSRDFRLPGLGSYLQKAANDGNTTAIVLGVLTLVSLVVLLDQLVWRPLLAWAEKFKIELVENDNPPTSWFFEVTGQSRLATGFTSRVVVPIVEALDRKFGGSFKEQFAPTTNAIPFWRKALRNGLLVLVAGVLIYGGFRAIQLLITVPLSGWGEIIVAVLATGARVAAALIIGVLWTVPVGVVIGTNPRMATLLQPVVQILASIPATALFPIMLLVLVNLPFGLNAAAILLMLLGTQWYVLFNVIAGASALPQDLKDIATMFKVGGWLRWKTLLLPALFPYLITGLITAGGGAWNASIVAEYTEFNNKTYTVTGLGAIISQATAKADYGLLLAGTLTMIGVVIMLNRFFWRRLYRLAEERYRMD
ncbi:MAG: ABC transporter permease subunit [Chloroflexota bacterium]